MLYWFWIQCWNILLSSLFVNIRKKEYCLATASISLSRINHAVFNTEASLDDHENTLERLYFSKTFVKACMTFSQRYVNMCSGLCYSWMDGDSWTIAPNKYKSMASCQFGQKNWVTYGMLSYIALFWSLHIWHIFTLDKEYMEEELKIMCIKFVDRNNGDRKHFRGW